MSDSTKSNNLASASERLEVGDDGADDDASNGIGSVDISVRVSSLLLTTISSNRELSVETPLARNSFSLKPR